MPHSLLRCPAQQPAAARRRLQAWANRALGIPKYKKSDVELSAEQLGVLDKFKGWTSPLW